MDWVESLQHITPTKTYSQLGEESIIQAIFGQIGTTNSYFVDFGAGDGVALSNTRLLKEQGWNGLMMDGDNKGSKEVMQEHITADNINKLFAKYNVPGKFDLLSLDIDGNDYWVWKALEYEPRVVVIEFNGTIPPYESKTIKYNPEHTWGKNDYYGASFTALKKLGETKGYTLVYQLGCTNMFFVKSGLTPSLHYGITYQTNQYHPKANYGEWITI